MDPGLKFIKHVRQAHLTAWFISNVSETSRSNSSITSLLNSISRERKIPLSTLKLNAKILRSLGLVEFSNGSNARLTDAGLLVLHIMGGNNGQ